MKEQRYVHIYSGSKTHVRVTSNRSKLFVLKKKEENSFNWIKDNLPVQSIGWKNRENEEAWYFLQMSWSLFIKCHVKIMPDVVTWDWVVMKHPGKEISCVKSHPKKRPTSSLCASGGTRKICAGYEAVLCCVGLSPAGQASPIPTLFSQYATTTAL